MRLFAALGIALITGVLVGSAAHAENRTFIIPSNSDGYGVDRCLASGEACGIAVANAYCASRSFAQAKSFQKIDRDEITGAVPTSSKDACVGSCDSYVAIVCAR
jgi:hypothetical protein